jgi:hypothetical protein
MTAAVPSSLCIDIIDNRAKAVACLDEAVPDDYLVRKIDAVLDLSWVYDRDRPLSMARTAQWSLFIFRVGPFCSAMVRPSASFKVPMPREEFHAAYIYDCASDRHVPCRPSGIRSRDAAQLICVSASGRR